MDLVKRTCPFTGKEQRFERLYLNIENELINENVFCLHGYVLSDGVRPAISQTAICAVPESCDSLELVSQCLGTIRSGIARAGVEIGNMSVGVRVNRTLWICDSSSNAEDLLIKALEWHNIIFIPEEGTHEDMFNDDFKNWILKYLYIRN